MKNTQKLIRDFKIADSIVSGIVEHRAQTFDEASGQWISHSAPEYDSALATAKKLYKELEAQGINPFA